ncbi:phage major tail protein, TP901-1 family [Maritalea porphyrae]|uniref:phage major tail protein, TP901-1 family n=1 Tax=Maritalea porphyrae TaxID=880732 RepID=UPI0022B03140|nr:phage major tail protein, TP901-1 family [Maritalea porphyrae]MCZ4271156.1 phage major tail protein, TP901-1 family [Maritalea porphyrae]
MSAQSGRDMLLKLDETGAGGFATVAGIRTRQLSFNAQSIDTTDSYSSGQWRELLSSGGIKKASLSGAGVFKDASSDAKIRELFFAGELRNWQLILPDFGTIEGLFQITALEFSADHTSEVSFDIALESAGLITFTVTP